MALISYSYLVIAICLHGYVVSKTPVTYNFQII